MRWCVHEYVRSEAHPAGTEWRQISAVVKHKKRWQVIISHISACDLTNNLGSNATRMGKQAVNSSSLLVAQVMNIITDKQTQAPPYLNYGEMVNHWVRNTHNVAYTSKMDWDSNPLIKEPLLAWDPYFLLFSYHHVHCYLTLEKRA